MTEESISNYYEILGCDQESTYENLKQAYHELALRFHPDKVSNTADNGGEFQKIDEAWKVLRDPSLRRQYDVEFRQAKLEAESQLVYARITPGELEATDDENVMSYRCRCGSSYSVHSQDLNESNNVLHVYCDECTFMIIVET
ncbi:dnaJ homolog subfamily C member 24-like [Athalia rosae]|uniref:dnaJ homolog subfamily C member 24-like n=1 Tax=Athalia rosae TaxID=37344 RepID=UPI0006260F4B|nr:dnaJ homolog subfamily C member 24-like [Athalia rosae]